MRMHLRLRSWFLLSALLAACQAPEAPDSTVLDLARIAQDYPRVDGSTSAYPLQVLIACKMLQVPCAWTDFDGGNWLRFVQPQGTSAETPSAAEEKILGLVHTGTHDAYVNLIQGEADVILVARLPSHDELVGARMAGVRLEARPIALDALVFLVNEVNGVESIGLRELRAIYAGELTNWPQIEDCRGAEKCPQAAIRAYRRNANSGSEELIEKLVMQGTPMAEASQERMLTSMILPIEVIGGGPAVAGDVHGIAFSVYYYATFMAPSPGVKFVAVDGVTPTSASIADGSYPLAAEVYAVIRQGMPAESTAVMLRDWLLTPQGKALIAESGYVPLR